MLAIRRCLGSSKGAGDEKHKYYDIPSFPNEGFPLISTDDPLHAPPNEAQPQPNSEVEDGDESEIESQTEETLAQEPQPGETQVGEHLSDEIIVEEPQPDETLKVPQPVETLVEEPQKSDPEIQDLSTFFGLREPDHSSLYRCTEILGSESCDNMVNDMSEVVTEWSCSHKRQKHKAIDAEMLANRRLPPPIPRYIGRPCQLMKIQRCNRSITMSLVQMDQQPEQMPIEREDGVVKMQLMTYVGDAMNDNMEASTSASASASTTQQVVVTCDEETIGEEEELITDKLDSGGPEKECLAQAA